MLEKDLEIKILDYIDNNMSEEDREDFDELLSKDSKLKLEVESVKQMLADMKGLKKMKLDSSFDERLRHSIEDYESTKSKPFNILQLFNNPVYASIGAVAAMFLVVMTTIILNSSGPNSSKSYMIIKSNTESLDVENNDIVDSEDMDMELEDSKGGSDFQKNKNHNKILRVDDSNDN